MDFIIPEGVERINLRQLLFFTLGGVNFCVSLVEIMSVVHVEDVLVETPSDMELPDICRGFIRFQRTEIPLLDLRPKLGQSSRDIPSTANALMIDYGVTYLGLLVDFVYNIENVLEGYVLELPANVSELGSNFLVKYVVYPNGGAYRLNVQTFFSEEDLEALSAIL